MNDDVEAGKTTGETQLTFAWALVIYAVLTGVVNVIALIFVLAGASISAAYFMILVQVIFYAIFMVIFWALFRRYMRDNGLS